MPNSLWWTPRLAASTVLRIRSQNYGMKFHPLSKMLTLYFISNHFYRNGQGPNATVALDFMQIIRCLDILSNMLYILLNMLGSTRDSTFYILWTISVLFIDELYQFPYWRYHVSWFPNVCLLTCSHFTNHLYIWSSFTHHALFSTAVHLNHRLN